MRILIRNARITDLSHPLHNEHRDLLIEDGTLVRIGTGLEATADQVWESENLHVSAGWMDLHAHFCDPGEEHKETLRTGTEAARHGGFSHVVLSPLTDPVIDTKAQVEYILQQTRGSGVHLHPMGTLSLRGEGKDLSEMYDMFQAGARAFSDGTRSVMDPDMMRRSLLYSQNVGGFIVSRPHDRSISRQGVMNEGAMSTSLGLKGLPALAEELMVSRDLFLAGYCETRIHFQCISSAGSVQLIREAKARGKSVTCDVAFANLLWTDEVLEQFDTNYKVNPPLRMEADRQALLAGLADGTIDAIVSDHTPQNIEEKACEFDHAGFGISGIETLFPLCNTHLNGALELDQLIDRISRSPRTVWGLEQPRIEEGQPADLTVFDPSETWVITPETWKSRSKNNPAIGQEVIGRVHGVIA